MGNKTQSRRSFFRSLKNTNPENPATDPADPLFEKYSRKSLRPRYFAPEQVEHKLGLAESPELRVGNVTSGLAPYTGTWTEWEVLHLLRRTNFGGKKAWVDTLLPLGPSGAADAVLNVSSTPPAPPQVWYNTGTFVDENGLAQGADWTADFFPTGSVGGTSNRYRMDSLRRWLFGLTLNGDLTIREKMTWFWFHFIPIDFESIYQSSNSYVNTNCARIFYRYLKLLRDNATGNYKTLIRAICNEPAMMYYLNNQANTATAPDENFARELMELFTLGKDPASQYTQSDVVAAAKVLTGWRVQGLNSANVATNFLSSAHSTINKQFSAFFNNTVINYQSGTAGANELDQLINMIFAKQEVVSQYICRRLYRYFVYYDIDANVEANVIVPLAQTFVANNWNILPVLQQLFKSQHFYDMANRGACIKSPFDLVAGLLNSFNMNTSDANVEYQYRIWSRYNDSYCLGMEQQMGTMPNVSGWNAYYQTPAFHQYWINSNTIQKRFTFIKQQLDGYSIGSVPSRTFKIDWITWVQQFGNATVQDPNALIATAIKYLLSVDLSQAQKDTIKLNTLLSGQTTDSYWTTAWNNYIGTPTNNTFKGIVDQRLKSLLNTILQLAEYQLM